MNDMHITHTYSHIHSTTHPFTCILTIRLMLVASLIDRLLTSPLSFLFLALFFYSPSLSECIVWGSVVSCHECVLCDVYCVMCVHVSSVYVSNAFTHDTWNMSSVGTVNGLGWSRISLREFESESACLRVYVGA
jgi:hypothetical protein